MQKSLQDMLLCIFALIVSLYSTCAINRVLFMNILEFTGSALVHMERER